MPTFTTATPFSFSATKSGYINAYNYDDLGDGDESGFLATASGSLTLTFTPNASGGTIASGVGQTSFSGHAVNDSDGGNNDSFSYSGSDNTMDGGSLPAVGNTPVLYSAFWSFDTNGHAQFQGTLDSGGKSISGTIIISTYNSIPEGNNTTFSADMHRPLTLTLVDTVQPPIMKGALTVPGSVTASIASAGEHDWFTINLTAGQTYQFSIKSASANGVNSPLLKLYNGSSTFVVEGGQGVAGNDVANNDHTLITFKAPTSGTYYLDAESSVASAVGNYVISATNMVINITYDPSVANAPVGFKSAVATAVQYLETTFLGPVNLNFNVGWGEVDGKELIGGALAAAEPTLGEGATASDLLAALKRVGAPGSATLSLADLPVKLFTAQEKALGLLTNDTVSADGFIGVNSHDQYFYDPTHPEVGKYDLVGALEHEFTHDMGRDSGLNLGDKTSTGTLLDLFRYSSWNSSTLTGTRQTTNGNPSYFSIDGGKTNLNAFENPTNTTGVFDPADWISNSTVPDSFGVALLDPTKAIIEPVTATDLIVMRAIGWRTTTTAAPTTTTTTIQSDYLGIIRTSLPVDQATTVANAINTGTQTEAQYVNGLLSQVANTTVPAVAVEAMMYYGTTGTSAEITSLTTNFLPAQVANATANGLNPLVYASEALGLVFAFGNENGSTAFSSNFGPSSAGMPNSTAGDALFAAVASNTIFGSASTANLVNVMQGFVSNWKAFFTAHGVPGGTTAAQIDLAARGTAWGDMVGVALANNLGPLQGQAINFLDDAAQGSAVYGASLVGQPAHQPFQGA